MARTPATRKPRTRGTLSTSDAAALLAALQARFETHRHRHQGLDWARVEHRLAARPGALWSLDAMEQTGGEPDVVEYDETADQYVFMDCAAESPAGRRSVCYDDDALAARKLHKPAHSAVGMATAMGIALLTEAQYRALQALGVFDARTSSWVATPQDVRALGGALFGDRRFGRVFIYHNGAESYYGARGFRGALRV